MHMNWDTGNESDKFFGLDNSDTQNPVFIVFWRSECPSQECGTVVESEHVIFILNVILSQESVDLFLGWRKSILPDLDIYI